MDEDDQAPCYTSCTNCYWFGIPIIEGGAPELCEECEAGQ